MQQVAVALDAADPLADAGGVGPAAQGGQGVGAGVDDGDVVSEPGERDGEHAAAPADVEHAQRGAGADDRVERGPDGGGPGGQLLRGRRGRGRRHSRSLVAASEPAHRPRRVRTETPSAARLISARSIRRIWSIAWVARCARSGSGSLSSDIISMGVTCQETPNLSLSQPHWLSSPPSVSRFQ